MKWQISRNTSLVLASVLLAAIFVVGFSTVNLAVTTASALHTESNKIYNDSGQEVLLRGVGLAGFAPSLIFWGTGEGDAWSHQWTPASDSDVSQTFQQLRDVWHVNMIRFFFYPEWWWLDNVTPSVASGSGYSSTPVSTRNYVKTLATVAAQFGIYLDMVPYSLTAQSGTYASDPYLSTGGAGTIPMVGMWNTVQQQFISDTGYSEQEFWSQFWASVANELKGYPNVIFEAWNEPDISSPVNVIPTGYLSYLTTMYSAIRGTGATNLVMMQWKMGWVPNGWGASLAWASQLKNAIGNPTNLVYTTHFYYYSPSDTTRYWNQGEIYSKDGGVPKTVTQLQSDLQGLVISMGVSAPLVINEEGSCRSASTSLNNDYTWWGNMLQAQANLGIGMCAYYWLSDSGLGGVFSGLGQISSGYTPNTMGQKFIDVYGSTPSPSPTPTPSSIPTSDANQPTPSPTATPYGQTPQPSSAPNLPEQKPWWQEIIDFLRWLFNWQ